MRSLVFIALLGLALAVPVPHANPESEIFETAELDEDCYAEETVYEQGNIEDDLTMETFSEEQVNDDCLDDPIEEELLQDIVIQPGEQEDDIFYTPMEEEIDEDCEEEPQPTEAPPVITEAPFNEATPEDNSDCIGEDAEYFDEDLEEEPAENEPLDELSEHAYVEIDSVFEVQDENPVEGIEECIEY